MNEKERDDWNGLFADTDAPVRQWPDEKKRQFEEALIEIMTREKPPAEEAEDAYEEAVWRTWTEQNAAYKRQREKKEEAAS